MTDLQKSLLKTIEYFLNNDDVEGLASDLGIIISRTVCDDDIEDDIANALVLNYQELKKLDGEDEEVPALTAA